MHMDGVVSEQLLTPEVVTVTSWKAVGWDVTVL